ncbi:MAG: 5-oxoprolinase subunit PxpA [Pseudomonadota bacterium]
MARRINLNADLGESWGAYSIGDDAALLDVVKTANIACGLHGGDATVMRETIAAAARRGVSIGAHPGFNDLWGFGRRDIRMAARDIENLVAYQIGAMLGMAAAAGARVTHMKAHGALNTMACDDAEYAAAITRGLKATAPDLIHLVMPGTELDAATEAAGLPLAREAFVDRTYEANGRLTPRRIEGAVIRDPAAAAARAVEMVETGALTARTGETVRLPFESLCVHGDEPTAVAAARATRDGLAAAGVDLVTLPEMLA